MLAMRFKRILTSTQFKAIVTTLIILVLAFISTYPAFTGHFFALSNDGSIHLARLESLYQAFKADVCQVSSISLGLKTMASL